MFEIVPSNTNIDFIGRRRPAAILSAVLVAASLALLFVRGPNLGIDFGGGSLVHVRFAAPKTANEVRDALSAAGKPNLDIQDAGKGTEMLIRAPLEEGETGTGDRIATILREAFGKDQVDVLRVEAVGPRVGKELRQKATLAILLSTLIMGIYISIRFEWRFGLGTGVAILHDVITAVGLLILFNYEFDLNIVAALLTLVGFSVNDKVVVSDRIRESRHKDRRAALATVINRSINETLSRTILTNGTAFVAVLSLYLLGGPVLHGFAFVLVAGSIIGTYSSIFVATPVVLAFERDRAPVRQARRAAS